MRCVFVIVHVFVFSLGVLSAQKAYVVDTKYTVHDINPQLLVIQDVKGNLTIDQILQDTSLEYQPGDQLPRMLQVGVTHWGKIELKTTSELSGWTLHFRDYLIGAPAWSKSNGKVDVYGYVDGKLIFHKKTGVEYPKSQRDVRDKWVMNRVTLDDMPVDQLVTIVFKVQGNSIGFPSSFNLSVRSPQEAFYHQIYQAQNSFNLFMVGVTFIILLYHFLMFIYTRKEVFMWFSVWMAFCCITMAMSTGFIIGSFTEFRFPIWMILANGVVYSFWFFGRSFINSKYKFPKLDKLILGLAIFQIAEILITACYAIIFPEKVFLTQIGFHYQLLALGAVLSCVLSIILITKKDQFARYFGIGALIGSMLYVLANLWSIYHFRLPFDPYALSMFSQIVIFSFGIAYRRQQLSKYAEDEKLQTQMAKAETQRIKDLDEIKSKFFANISHEFRTPLSLITGPIEHAARLKRSANARSDAPIEITPKTFTIIKNNTKRLQTLVDQLLDLSKIESGHVHLSLVQGSIVKFVRSIAASFESMAERQNISLHMSFPQEWHGAFYDKDKLEKIITNLLSNAFKYTPDGGSVSIAMVINGSHYTIEIGDTGKGIQQKDLKKIFDRFYRIEGSEAKGSGIGLALTKELIDLHNGQIHVDSTIGQGTTFKIRMPHTPTGLPEAISVYTSGQVVGESKMHVGAEILEDTSDEFESNMAPSLAEKPVVLVVEDNSDLQEFIGQILSHNYQVLKASDGMQGERMAYEHVPEIIISDVMMPKKDGYELCHDLKSNTKTSHIPIIMLTAKAGHSNKMEGLTLGADAYLTKPFNEDELLIKMRNLLDLRKNLWEHYKSLDLAILPDLDMVSAEDKFMQSVIQAIKENIDNERLSVEELARHVGFSRSQLHRKLKAITNKSANQFIVEIRLNEAHRMLERQLGSVSEIAYSVGYSNMSYFTKSFKDKFGILPSKINTHA